MTRLLPTLFTALLACAPACRAQAQTPAPAPADAVNIDITMRDPSALDVSYALPPGCTALAFRNDGMSAETIAALRRDWRPADDCTVIDGAGLHPARAACTTLRVRVPATDRDLDRVYPWAYPVGQGLYLHTSAYAPTDACGGAAWTFAAPGGTVIVDGVVTAQRGAHAASGGAAMPVVLLKEALQPGAKRVHADARVDAPTLAMIEATAPDAERQLKRDLPGVSFTTPYIVATLAAPGYWHGDMANRTVMRLALQRGTDREHADMLRKFVTHEMSHMTQPVDWHDAWGEDDALIGEGGAELLRVAVTTQLGWYDRARLEATLANAVNGCALAAGGKNYKSIRNRGRGQVPYDCGLAFHLLALGANPGPQAPLLRLRDYDVAARSGAQTDFAQALECGDRAGCAPRWLARLAGAETLDSVLLDYARQSASLLRVASAWTPDTVELLAYRHIGQLMRADCGGALDMTPEPGAARIGDEPRCATLRADMVVVAAQGLPLFADGAALRASVQACRDTGKTVLGLKDGRSVQLSCGATVDLPAHLYAVDGAGALRVLRTPD